MRDKIEFDNSTRQIFSFIISLIIPILLGIVIAFILNIPTSFFEEKGIDLEILK